MSAEKFDQIIAAQLPQAQKMRLADLALPTALGRAESHRQLKKWLEKSDKQQTCFLLLVTNF